MSAHKGSSLAPYSDLTNNRLIIVGASGTIGTELYTAAKAAAPSTVGTYNSRPSDGLVRFSLLDGRIRDSVPDLGPNDTAILLAAAIDPDWVYLNQDLSRRMNVDGTIRCADDVLAAGGRVFFISSEAVFSKDRECGYVETDAPSPATTYAGQKVEVETYLRGLPRAGVLRLGRNIGWNRSDFYCPVRLTHKALLSGTARMAIDNVITLTDVRDTVAGILRAAQAGLDGILHLAANPPICRTDLAEAVIKASRRAAEMSYEAIRFADLGFDEMRSRCAWLNSERSTTEMGCVYRAPEAVIRQKVRLIEEWETIRT